MTNKAICDSIKNDIWAWQLKMLQHKALNFAIYQMVDEADRPNIDSSVRVILSHAFSLLNLQEEMLEALEKDILKVEARLSDIKFSDDEQTSK